MLSIATNSRIVTLHCELVRTNTHLIYLFFYVDRRRPAQFKACFGYVNVVSSRTSSAGHVGAALLPHVTCRSRLRTNDVRLN